MIRSPLKGVHLLAALVTTLASSTARGDGNQAHGETYRVSGPGMGITAGGVGLAGRREFGAAVPIDTAAIVVSGIPDGANVEAAFLYWVTYADVGDATVTLDGADLTGTLIGTSANTCWNAPFDGYDNHVYRADVGAIVDGNGSYVIDGFPSGLATADTQGASIVTVFQDPSDELVGTVVLRDGAITVNPSFTGGTTFAGVIVPSGLEAARFRLGVGDGQPGGLDGLLRFNDQNLPAPNGVQHWLSGAGTYWDLGSYDVTTRLTAGDADIAWSQAFRSDCLVFAYSSLDIHGEVVDEDADGIDDAIDNCVGDFNPDQADGDDDGVGDACDNCPDDENTNQQDVDDDGVGDVCDNCLDASNSDQSDVDDDGRGDVCDNCPDVFNPTQTDSDLDGVGDACEGGEGLGGEGPGGEGPGGEGPGGEGPGSGGNGAGGEPGSGGAPATSGGATSSSSGGDSGSSPAGAGPVTSGGATTAASGAGGGCDCKAASGANDARSAWAAAVAAVLAFAARRRRVR